jgi:hypothetical protein
MKVHEASETEQTEEQRMDLENEYSIEMRFMF